ncbi:MAG: hypothetical protein AAF560_22145 [Acidobacteriota bacterium]
MKRAWKLSLSIAAVAALVLTLGAFTSEPADAILTCPTVHCSDVLDGWTYLGPCSTGNCLGWAYRKGAETCHVPALGGI